MTDTTLLAWMSGALEPGDAAEVSIRVRTEPLLQARAAALRPLLDTMSVQSGWRIPPPGLAGGRRPVGMQALRMTMDTGPVNPLGGFSIRIAPSTGSQERYVVVLAQAEGEWSVVFPQSAEEALRLGELPEEPDGSRLLELVAGETLGAQRWAVALPEQDGDWGGEVWGGLQARIADGQVPVTAVEVVVGFVEE